MVYAWFSSTPDPKVSKKEKQIESVLIAIFSLIVITAFFTLCFWSIIMYYLF